MNDFDDLLEAFDNLPAPPEHEGVSPFSSGSQDAAWDSRNCQRCKKGYYNSGEKFVCDIEQALFEAYCNDGYVSEEIAKRMGYYENNGEDGFSYTWVCPERELTED